MTTRVIMNTSRPNGSGGTYKAGVEYDLADDLAELWRGQGICRRTSVRSEQTGAVVSATAGNFPDAPGQSQDLPLTVRQSGEGVVKGQLAVSAGGRSLGLIRPTARHVGYSAADFSVAPVYVSGCTADVVDDNPNNAAIGGPPAARRYGGKRIKLTCNAAGTMQAQWLINATDLAELQKDGRIELWIEVEDRTKFNSSNSVVNFQLDDTTTSSFAGVTLIGTGSIALGANNGLQVFGGLKTDFTGTGNPATWPTIKRARITISQVSVGAVIYLCWMPAARKGGKPMLVLQQDGCWLSQYQNALPRLTARGLVGTFSAMRSAFGVSSNGVPRATLEQVLAIQAAGHQIISHTLKPTNQFASAQEAFDSVMGNISALASDGINVGRAVMYSGGAANWSENGLELADMLRADGSVFGACISTAGANVPVALQGAHVPMPLDFRRYTCPREIIQGSALTVTDIDTKWDALLARGAAGYSAIASVHHVLDVPANPDELATALYERHLDRAVDAVRSGVFENVTTEEFFCRI